MAAASLPTSIASRNSASLSAAQFAHATFPDFEPSWREFQRGSGKTEKYWAISVEPDGESYRVRRRQGDGEVSEDEIKRPGAHGKPGSRTYVSAPDACLREVERLIHVQRQKGFGELVGGKFVEAAVLEIDFSRPFPPTLLTPKPRSSVSEKELRKLHDADRLAYTRKYDGMGVTLVRHTYGWEAYTLSNNIVSEFFAPQLAALERTSFGVGTILKGEAVIFKKEDPWHEDFNLMIARFGPTRDPGTTRAMISNGEIPEPSFVIYDILYHNGRELHDIPYGERAEHWRNLPVARGGNGPLVSAEFMRDITPDNWLERRIEYKVEGWVANDTAAVLGRNALTFGQSPARPSGIFKLKPNTEEDVVIFAVRQVDGEYQSVFTKQRYPDFYPDTDVPVPNAGNWFYTGRVSLHRSPRVIAEIEKLVEAGLIQVVPDNKTGEALPISNEKGVTAVIEFFERQKGGKFRHAVFPEELRFRTKGSGDYKAPRHCVAQTYPVPIES